MKPSLDELTDLHAGIVAACRASGLSKAQIAKAARVSPSQVSRICNGKFRTFSHNVVQVCVAVGVSTAPSPRFAFPPEAA